MGTQGTVINGAATSHATGSRIESDMNDNDKNFRDPYWNSAARMLLARPGSSQTVAMIRNMAVVAADRGKLFDCPSDWGWPPALDLPQ
jgi:hypothetical protein